MAVSDGAWGVVLLLEDGVELLDVEWGELPEFLVADVGDDVVVKHLFVAAVGGFGDFVFVGGFEPLVEVFGDGDGGGVA